MAENDVDITESGIQRHRDIKHLYEAEHLRLSNVEDTKVEIGRGAYGKVIEVKVDGKHYAVAKVMHSGIKSDLNNFKFLTECFRISHMLHPNIVQFLGIHYPSDPTMNLTQNGAPQSVHTMPLPWLVMEKLHFSLGKLIEDYHNRTKDIPFHLKLSILLDTCNGLQFLHSRNILHRDLSSGNILLTKYFVAKIADLGNARQIVREGLRLTTMPGTPIFMPPEANSRSYGKPLDVFSLACVCIHLVSMVDWPIPEDIDETELALAEIPFIEFIRRKKYLVKFDNFPFNMVKEMVKKCLNKDAAQRPTVEDVITQLEKIQHDRENLPHEHDNISELFMLLWTSEKKVIILEQENKEFKKENQKLQKQLQHMESLSKVQMDLIERQKHNLEGCSMALTLHGLELHNAQDDLLHKEKELLDTKRKLDKANEKLAKEECENDDSSTFRCIDGGNMNFIQELKTGNNYTVYKARWNHKNESQTVAVKKIKEGQVMQSEAYILSKLVHPNIIMVYGVTLFPTTQMVLEYASEGDLLSFMRNEANVHVFTVHLLHKFAEQLASALEYLKGKRIVHQNLAAKNILVGSHGAVKLSSFEKAQTLETLHCKVPVPTERKAWNPPEVFQEKIFSTASDVWSYAVVLWEIYSLGSYEGLSCEEMADKIFKSMELPKPKRCHPDVYRVMLQCWKHTQERITSTNICSELAKINYEQVLTIRKSQNNEGYQNGPKDYLIYKKHDTIAVIDRHGTNLCTGIHNGTGMFGWFSPSDTQASSDTQAFANQTQVDGKKRVSRRISGIFHRRTSSAGEPIIIGEPINLKHDSYRGDGTKPVNRNEAQSYGLASEIKRSDSLPDVRPRIKRPLFMTFSPRRNTRQTDTSPNVSPLVAPPPPNAVVEDDSEVAVTLRKHLPDISDDMIQNGIRDIKLQYLIAKKPDNITNDDCIRALKECQWNVKKATEWLTIQKAKVDNALSKYQ